MSDSQIVVNPTHIPAADRSAHYGDASFTTMYARHGIIVMLDAHIKRLQNACTRLDIQFTDWVMLRAELDKLMSANHQTCAVKIIISRGCGGRGYQAPERQQPLCVVSLHNCDEMGDKSYVELIKVSQIQLPDVGVLAELKHSNRLAQVMAKEEAKLLGCDDVLMCDAKQHAIEASSANVFYLLDNCWYTPPLTHGGVNGIMRTALLNYFHHEGVFVNIASHHVEQLRQAKSMLLTNAIKGVMQVRKFEYRDEIMVFDADLSTFISSFIRHLQDSQEISKC